MNDWAAAAFGICSLAIICITIMFLASNRSGPKDKP